jgi:hypothetical protein
MTDMPCGWCGRWFEIRKDLRRSIVIEEEFDPYDEAIHDEDYPEFAQSVEEGRYELCNECFITLKEHRPHEVR